VSCEIADKSTSAVDCDDGNQSIAEDSSVVEQIFDHSIKADDESDKVSEAAESLVDIKVQRYECTNCPKSFARKNELVKHQYIHRENPQMSCTPCNKGFTTELQLRRHNNAHHKVATGPGGGSVVRKQHICNNCSAVFRTNKALEQHHVAEHVSEKRFHCRVCGAEFSWEVNLQRHELVRLSVN